MINVNVNGPASKGPQAPKPQASSHTQRPRYFVTECIYAYMHRCSIHFCKRICVCLCVCVSYFFLVYLQVFSNGYTRRACETCFTLPPFIPSGDDPAALLPQSQPGTCTSTHINTRHCPVCHVQGWPGLSGLFVCVRIAFVYVTSVPCANLTWILNISSLVLLLTSLPPAQDEQDLGMTPAKLTNIPLTPRELLVLEVYYSCMHVLEDILERE